jgi:hypothetical protein
VHWPGINGASAQTLLTGIHYALGLAGWFSNPVEGGYEYIIYSPQGAGLRARCRITDTYRWGGHSGLVVQFLSFNGTRVGFPHPILYKPGRFYEVTANKCQLFLATTGHSSDSPEGEGGAWGNFVCGGIPYLPQLPDMCLQEPMPEQEVFEAWWSSGSDNNGAAANGYGFRVGWRNRWAWDGCWNGSLVSGYASPEQSVLRLGVLAQPYPDYGIYPSYQQTQWALGTPLYIEPFLIWGETREAPGRLRGQIWDAMWCTLDQPLDSEIQTFEPPLGWLTWRNWTHFKGNMSKGAAGSYYGSLYLLKKFDLEPDAPVESNYAY